MSAQSNVSSIADILFKNKVINAQARDIIKSDQVNHGISQEEIIKRRNIASEYDLVMAKAELNSIPFINIKTVGIEMQALNYIPQSVASRFSALPYKYVDQGKQLHVVMADPIDVVALDFLNQKSGCRVIPYFGVKADIDKMISEKYSQGLSSSVDAALKETNESKNEEVIDVDSLSDVIREAPIAKIVGTLLSFAMKSMASDIHIDPLEDKTRIRYRIDGILHEKLVLPKSVHEAVISRIKILAKMKIDEKRIPQDGRFAFRSGNEEVDLRVSSLPTVNGEKIVMRLLKKGGKIPTFQELGIRGMGLKSLEESVIKSNGIVLITGPTGSGKTTTLYSILNKISTPKVNVITIEDPVEYQLEGISQVQVNNLAGLTFSSGLRSFLRQDPDVIMVGEIRDQETAELAVHAALTGHMVFSTLHTNSAAGALPRLIDMGIEPFLLSSAIQCVVGQRVVRKVCEHCKQQYTPDPGVIANIKQVLGSIYHSYEGKNIQLVKGSGCDQCNDSGYSGRIGIYEIMPMNERLGKMIISQATSSDIEQEAIHNGMLTMKMDGYIKALDGITTIEEVLRVSNS